MSSSNSIQEAGITLYNLPVSELGSMILKGNQRGDGRQMLLHLLNVEANEYVNVHEVGSFMENDVLGAFNDIHAISKGPKCTPFMYSLSLNTQLDESESIETF